VKASLCWLSSLKMAQLTDIARLTGIRSAGPKNALIQRLNTELQRSESLLRAQRPDGQSESLQNSHKINGLGNGNTMPLMKDLSVLSIDMGIQNLAFAHLLVPAPGQKLHPYPSGPLPILNAWERLAISEIPIESPSPSSFSLPLALARPQRRKRRSINTSTAANVQREAADLNCDKAERLQGIPFSPEIYALRAYTLIKSLITSYRPTHILIERQRFRTGGGSAVQEWTLRVGIFEGMLHAVLHTLGRERVHCLAVHSVEPKMVTSYWRIGATDTADTSEFSKPGEKKRRTPRDVKKEKINLIGQFLTTSMEDNVPKSQFSGSVKLAFGSETDLKETVDAYLQKWKGERASRGSHGSAPLGKLDDLADCLLQGVTWLEWQVMRSKVVADGVDALSYSRGSDPGDATTEKDK
jgi:cruciform cutting endonuclease 1